MNLYLVNFDGDSWVVSANGFADAVRIWQENAEVKECLDDEPGEPDSVTHLTGNALVCEAQAARTERR